jgi:predicted metal-dependent phosphoesterase TrpH
MADTTSRNARGIVNGTAYQEGLAYRKADLHLHSNYSYDVLNIDDLSPRALYDKAVRQGMGFFTLTDHDTLKGIEALRAELTAEFGDHPPIPILNGVEMRLMDPSIGHYIHVNVLGLDRAQFQELARRRRSVARFVEYCREQDLYHAYNHPFWFERGQKGSLAAVTRLVEMFPVIELNAGRIPQLNKRTLELARRFGKQVVASSDSHTGQVGKAYTMAPGETAEEFLRNIRSGVSRAVPSNASFSEFMREVRETIDLVFIKQSAFTPKRTFLKSTPVARAIARTALGSELLMGPRPLKRVVQEALQVIAYAPVYAFILQQRRMDWRMGEVTA